MKKFPYPWYARETMQHQFPLTDEEKLTLATLMSEAKCEINKLENELALLKKDYKEKIDAYSGELSKAATRYKLGLAPPVDVLCDCLQDFDKQEMVYISVESAEELMRRPMTAKEKQPSLFSSRQESKILPFSNN